MLSMLAYRIRALPPMLALAAMGGACLQARDALAEEVTADVTASTASVDTSRSSNDDAILLAGKIGGIAPFNGLSPFVAAGIEGGYIFGNTQRRIGVLLDVEYTAPKGDGTKEESFNPERIPGGSYDWELRQKELTFQPTFLYRLTGVTDILTPYAGIGPRIYFLESVVRGSAGDQKFKDTKEQSTKFGVGVPLGVEVALGPGGLLAELLFQWAPLDHEATGDSHLAGLSLFVGYRALL